jgi:hypothetical protein
MLRPEGKTLAHSRMYSKHHYIHTTHADVAIRIYLGHTRRPEFRTKVRARAFIPRVSYHQAQHLGFTHSPPLHVWPKHGQEAMCIQGDPLVAKGANGHSISSERVVTELCKSWCGWPILGRQRGPHGSGRCEMWPKRRDWYHFGSGRTPDESLIWAEMILWTVVPCVDWDPTVWWPSMQSDIMSLVCHHSVFLSRVLYETWIKHIVLVHDVGHGVFHGRIHHLGRVNNHVRPVLRIWQRPCRAAPAHGHRSELVLVLAHRSMTAGPAISVAVVAMHTLHVIPSVPSAWKSVARLGSFAIRKVAEIRMHPMVVHSMCFSLMPEQTRVRGEAQILTVLVGGGMCACIWPKVGVQELAVVSSLISVYDVEEGNETYANRHFCLTGL